MLLFVCGHLIIAHMLFRPTRLSKKYSWNWEAPALCSHVQYFYTYINCMVKNHSWPSHQHMIPLQTVLTNPTLAPWQCWSLNLDLLINKPTTTWVTTASRTFLGPLFLVTCFKTSNNLRNFLGPLFLRRFVKGAMYPRTFLGPVWGNLCLHFSMVLQFQVPIFSIFLSDSCVSFFFLINSPRFLGSLCPPGSMLHSQVLSI